MTVPGAVECLFRREYGRLVALLVQRVGSRHLEDIEDAVQSAMMAALDNWGRLGPPDNPTAWLFRVARNNLLGEFRRHGTRRRVLEAQGADVAAMLEVGAGDFPAGEASRDLLRMLFACCDEAIPEESQLVLALKVLCGLGVREIAHGLFTTEANIHKRLGRARDRLREISFRPGDVDWEREPGRLPTVRRILYLLFTEGHLSASDESGIRREICEEAIRLTFLLAEHDCGREPETFALLALMLLHAARSDARLDAGGGLLLLEEQDRGKWDWVRIETGMQWLARSAQGDRFSRYHAEAGIAAEHCRASSFGATRWDRVAECYELLERQAPSPLHRLNRAIAVAEWRGPAEGLAVLNGFEPPTWLVGSHLWSAVSADLHRRCGHGDAARRHRDRAIKLAPTEAVKLLLRRRLDQGEAR